MTVNDSPMATEFPYSTQTTKRFNEAMNWAQTRNSIHSFPKQTQFYWIKVKLYLKSQTKISIIISNAILWEKLCDKGFGCESQDVIRRQSNPNSGQSLPVMVVIGSHWQSLPVIPNLSMLLMYKTIANWIEFPFDRMNSIMAVIVFRNFTETQTLYN